jgi:D-alanyl-D-alanine dipeptidase
MKYFALFLVLTLPVYLSGQSRYDLVDIQKVNSHIQLDLRYATENNFLGHAVYPEARCFVRYAVAVRLDSIQKELETIGLGLKIFDGFRPLAVQRQMWKVMPDSRYVANPYKNGSRHNRGAAVDVSLVDTSGSELDMPTGFDNFTVKAHHAFQKLPADKKQNRWILRTIMEKYGFKPITSEWWHYDLINWREFDIVDVSLDSLYQTDYIYPIR